MKKLLSVLLVLALAGGIAAFSAVGASAATDITAKFTDPNFKAVVYEAIGKTAPAPILDTDVAKIDEYLDASYEDIQSLAGLEYFVNLEKLYCVKNQLTELPTLPNSLTYLSCSQNQLTELPALPDSLTSLSCSQNQLTELPALPDSLTSLSCYRNQLTELPTLPNSLNTLDCSENPLGQLPTLPNSLAYLNCAAAKLTALPTLPNGLWFLNCGNYLYSDKSGTYTCDPSTRNQIKVLPTLPPSLTILYCAGNQLTALDLTGLSLNLLNCSYNNMKSTSDVKGFTGKWDYGFVYEPQNVTQTEPKTHCWDNCPAWAVWLLRYLCFGWLWMRWF